MIDTWVADRDVPAVSAAVVSESGTIEERHAGAGSANALYALASLTKPAVAAACMVAAEEGALDLDAPVAAHLPDYRTPPKAQITARHLLSHASGLPESDRSGIPAVEVEPVAPPATRRIYSNEGYAVLGELILAATGIPHARYVHEAVFAPLGMDAVIGLPEAKQGRALDVREPGLAAPGVALFNSRRWRQRGTAAGGAFATLGAYARFVQMLLAGGAPLIDESSFQDMAAVQYPGLPGGIESFVTWPVADWSLGCDVRDAKSPHWTGARTSPSALSHFGASGTLFFADREAGAGLVCLANRGTYSGWTMRAGGWPDLCEHVLAEFLPIRG
ncbi:MAG: serine hydrolase domain-containing protein [Gaiellales bacterium]